MTCEPFKTLHPQEPPADQCTSCLASADKWTAQGCDPQAIAKRSIDCMAPGQLKYEARCLGSGGGSCMRRRLQAPRQQRRQRTCGGAGGGAGHERNAGGGATAAGDDGQGGGLARPVGAQESEALPRPHAQAQVLQRLGAGHGIARECTAYRCP